MKKPVIYVDMYFSNKQIINIGLVLFVFFESTVVIAAPVEDNVLDSILNKYETAAQTWGHVMLNYASWLFWSLVLLSMVWTFGMMVLKRADIQEFLAEMIRFLAVTSFFWWLLYNGPVIANSIIQSMWQIGAKATGQTALSTPSGVVQTGLDILWKMISQISPLLTIKQLCPSVHSSWPCCS